MPFFDRYVPNWQYIKSTLFYDLWGRPTLEFSPTCGKSIEEAMQNLNEI
jgi:hypothetical protein